MLSVRGLTVEIGGTLVVEGAGFTVRAGDRIGLVGRNGAGKTSLLRVLGGMSPPKAGVIRRPPAFGYLPQEPRLEDVPPEVTALTHVLGGRGLDELAARMEELHRKMEAQPGDERLVNRWSRAHDAFDHAP
jgi:ATPase subunit of ABC transporter with duplicated ATPase domains